MKKKLLAHQETISILSKAKEAQIKLYKTREEKELDKVIALENKVKVLDNIIYKTGQSVQTMNMLNRNCKMNFAKPKFLKKAQIANPRLYDIDESIPYDQKCKSSKELFKIQRSVGTIIDGVERCKQKIAKRTYFGHIDPFIQNTIEANFCPEIRRINADLEKFHLCLKEEMVADLRYVNSLELEDLKAQLQDKAIAISELKKLIEKLKEKSMDTKFEKSSVIRQPNAFKSQRPSIFGKPTIFLDSLERTDWLKSKSDTKNNVSNDFSKPVTIQILPPNKKSILKNTNVLALKMYKLHIKPTQTRTTQLPHDFRKTNKHVSFSTGVIPTTSVSRPQLERNPMEDRVLLNNSQGKKQEVEDHRRNVKFSKNKTSVTACNDSLKAKTSNVNFVCATCGKYVLNVKHDMCVLQNLNGVNSRTKMPIIVPVSTREPKRIIDKSVAKPLKRTLIKIILFIVDSGCSKHMTRNLKLLISFVEKFLGSRGTDLYSITLQYTSSPNLVFLMAKATSSQAWLWHRRLSHLNFDTINLLSKNDIAICNTLNFQATLAEGSIGVTS
nr:integrase, catalytic region, zinc finger, CCHC-type, peptidase aspartic, catalytic [Tanacetum cinerariifolium]